MAEIKAFEEAQEWERPEITHEESTTGEYPIEFIDDQKHTGKVRAWLMIEGESDDRYDDDVWMTILSSFPYPYPDAETAEANPNRVPQHLVDYEIENMGLECMAGIGKGEEFETIKTFMDKHGLQVNQPFRAELGVEYFMSGSYDCQEWDSQSWLEVLEKGNII